MIRNLRKLLNSNSLIRYSNGYYSKKSSDVTESCYQPISSKKNGKKKNAAKYPKYSTSDLLIQPRDFPFFLPGNVGLAWQTSESTLATSDDIQLLPDNDIRNSRLTLQVNSCPIVMKIHLSRIFSTYHLTDADMSIITFSMRYNREEYASNLEMELEKTAKVFVVNAKQICDRLERAGFWADFINPFSGKPYTVPTFRNHTYAKEKIDEYSNFYTSIFNECKVVSKNNLKRKFIGNIFTNAPLKRSELDPILWQDNIITF